MLLIHSLPIVSLADDSPTESPPEFRISLIFSGEGRPYQGFEYGFRSALLAGNIVFSGNVEGLSSSDIPESDLLVTVGSNASRWALANTEYPIMASMLPEESLDSMRAEHQTRFLSGLYIDQPLDRHYRLANSLLPELTRLAVMSGGFRNETEEKLRATGDALGISIQTRQTESRTEVIRSINQLSDTVDAILLLPSRQTLDAQSLRAFLVTSFRAGIPVLTYSPGIVSAGSLAAIHSDPEILGQETAELINLNQKQPAADWPAAGHPRHFELSVNRDVANALGIEISDEGDIRRKILEQELSDAP